MDVVEVVLLPPMVVMKTSVSAVVTPTVVEGQVARAPPEVSGQV